jgi:thiazole synthase ThiGH ThiG subunit
MSKVELSDFQKRFLLGQGAGQTLYTAKEFEEALAQAKAEIMAVAIQTSKQAIFIEREACAELIDGLADNEDEGETCAALRNAAEAIRNRIPSQRQ